MTLSKIDLILNRLKKENETFKVFFISVDPDRDTPDVVKDYLSNFENKIIGITGEPEKFFTISIVGNYESKDLFRKWRI